MDGSGPQPHNQPIATRRNITFLSFVILICLIAGIVGALFQSQYSPPFSAIQLAIADQRWSDAESLARAWLERHPDDLEAKMLLGKSLQQLGSESEAVTLYRQVSARSGTNQIAARLAIVSIFLDQGRLAEAETELRSTPSDSGDAGVSDELWVRLLSFSGRKWESIPDTRRALGTVADRRMMLIYLANPDEMPAPPEQVLANMLRVRDPLALLGSGRLAASLGRNDQARKLYLECLAQRPDLIEALVSLGALLIDSGDESEIDQFLARLPRAADAHPTTWFLRGRRAQERNQRREAIRCYWEVLQRQPNHDRATYQLGLLLAAEGRIDDAKVITDRAQRLTKLIEHSVKLYEQLGGTQEIAACADLTFELGRLRECRAWCDELQRSAPDSPRLVPLKQALGSEPDENLPWLTADANLSMRFDCSTYPLPRFDAGQTPSQTHPQVSKLGASHIQFDDQSRRLGLDFIYFNSDDPSSPGKRMFEYTGGGVAAFDYDLDGWCDLYFTQGTTWPPDPGNQTYLDVLFRNVEGQRVQNVTKHTGIHDIGFGQGVAAGDINNDGFPDLYVANIDGNRLYLNRGDGTFSDVTAASGLATKYWTTSCLVADLDGDSLPDIYDVTFLEGDDVFTRICQGPDGIAASCMPTLFSAAVDHVYRNQGDGTFREMTQEWGFDASDGDGLGIVAGDFDDSGTISLFIGNDGRANFFFVPEITGAGSIHWNEIGVLSGLAYDDAGAAQACMGIGAGDPNNDGRLDLFVTNFYNESNTLYLNLGSRTFTDRARSMGLREPGWSMLGFGTQFVDADRDGWEDLIVVNGHVDDFTHKQIPYKMRPQFFQNQRSRFVERFSKDIGPFFNEPKLGRGVARLDWNRDGLADVAMSHIGDPAALLINTSSNVGNGLAIKLVGTTRSRDAIGTRVSVSSAAMHLTRQLTGGDGYQSTNERRIEFGLGNNSEPVEVVIRWMGGRVETFKEIETNQEYLAVEGRGELLRRRID